MKTTTITKIGSLIVDLFELLDTIEKQRVLNKLDESITDKQLHVPKKLTRKEIVNEMALQINRSTITK